MIKKLVFDLHQVGRRRLGTEVNIMMPWYTATEISMLIAWAVSNQTKLEGVLQFMIIDWTFFVLKCFGPSLYAQSNASAKQFRRIATHGRPEPPQGIDDNAYPKRTYRMYELYAESCSNSIGLTMLFALVAVAPLGILDDQMSFKIQRFFMPAGGYSCFYVGLVWVSSIIQDFFIQWWSGRHVNNDFSTLFSSTAPHFPILCVLCMNLAGAKVLAGMMIDFNDSRFGPTATYGGPDPESGRDTFRPVYWKLPGGDGDPLQSPDVQSSREAAIRYWEWMGEWIFSVFGWEALNYAKWGLKYMLGVVTMQMWFILRQWFFSKCEKKIDNKGNPTEEPEPLKTKTKVLALIIFLYSARHGTSISMANLMKMLKPDRLIYCLFMDCED
jgi:hypothetical protein